MKKLFSIFILFSMCFIQSAFCGESESDFSEREAVELFESVFGIDREGGFDNAVCILQRTADDMNSRLGSEYTALTLVQKIKEEIGNEHLPMEAYHFMINFFSSIENYILEQGDNQ